MELRPLPPFYAVYLLRSQRHPSSLYVGSTPNPRRRLAQHNGTSRGGALKTRRAAPWDMVCLVQGFPSSVAALQFEWTWQNPHLTRRIAPEERITHPGSTTSYRSGRPRKRPTRPRVGLKDRLANLNLLLHVPSFARWPLKVRFFAEDVYSVWREKVVSEDGSVETFLDFPIEGTLDAPVEQTAAEKEPPKRKRRKKAASSELPANVKVVHEGGIPALDVSYKRFRPVLEKGRFVLAESETVRCAVCSGRIRDEEFPVTLLCLKDGCHAASHLGCLSQHFLAHEKPGSDRQPNAMIPSEGKCPSCGEVAEWVDLITALSLRMRDPKMVNQILEKRKGSKRKDPSLGQDWREHRVVPDSEEDLAAEQDDDNLPEDEEFDFEDDEPGVDADEADEALRPEDVVDESLLREVDGEADASSVASSDAAAPATSRPKPRPIFRMPPELTVTIEDSEDEPGR